MRSLARAVVAGSVATMILVAPLAARADDDDAPKLVAKTGAFTWERTLLRMTVAYREVVDDEIATKIRGGTPQTIVLRAYVFEEGADTPIALTAKSCKVTWDLWEEVFTFKVVQPGGESTPSPAPNLEGVLNRCATAQGLAVIDRTRLSPNKRYVIQGLVEVNPVSQEMLERIKKWVSRPSGATTLGAGDALFSSFVGLFVTRIGTADRVLKFRTQAFSPPPPPPP